MPSTRFSVLHWKENPLRQVLAGLCLGKIAFDRFGFSIPEVGFSGIFLGSFDWDTNFDTGLVDAEPSGIGYKTPDII